jgi:Leucine-rich repeat (LRR) protein
MTTESKPEACSTLNQDNDQSDNCSSDANVSGELDRQIAQDATNDADITDQENHVADASLGSLSTKGFDDDTKTCAGSFSVGGSSEEPWVTTGSPRPRSIRHAKYEALGAPLSPFSTSETAASPVAVLEEDSMDKFRQLDALAASQVVDELRDSSHRREQSRTVPLGHVFADALVLGDEHDSQMSLPVQSIQANDVRVRIPNVNHGNGPPESSPDNATGKSLSRNYGRFCGLIVVPLVLLSAGAVTLTCGVSGCSPKASKEAPANSLEDPVSSTMPSAPDAVDLSELTMLINEITLSNRTIAELTNDTNSDRYPVEERALQWLLHSDNLTLQPGTPSNQFRVLQRYAMATLWIKEMDKMDSYELAHECTWKGVTCDTIEVDPTIGAQQVVTDIRLQDSDWQGEFCADIGLLSNLLSINFAGNSLSGTLPDTIGRWTNLVLFIVWDNQFTGTLPSTIGAWTNVAYVDLDENDLTGTLPDTIGQWSRLSAIQMAHNAFTGTLPDSIGHWTKLTYINIAWNNFSGSLPSTVGQWTKLEDFNAPMNFMTGTLPTAVGRWTNLKTFDFNSNPLRGTLPPSIGQWTNLVQFKMDHGNFTGSVPTSVVNWTRIEQFVILANMFTGVLPSELCHAVNLTDFSADCLTEVKCECCTKCF